jgi:predicted nucleotidyltransferase
MTIDELRVNKLIILECISGSKAYGLDTPTSDTDIKGVFVLPKEMFYGLDAIPQVSNDTHDIVFYELGRYMELLAQNNPNIIELLNTPDDAVIYKHPSLKRIEPARVLSKQCANTFGKYAYAQIKKAKGLNKKIVNPVAKKRRDLMSFCYVNAANGAVPLDEFLQARNWQAGNCGLVNIPHMRDIYGLYYSDTIPYRGIVSHATSSEVCLSSIPKGENQVALLYVNRDGFSRHCREYKEYWDWVARRNETRYKNTRSHGKNYDAKNMMHVFRLLEMAIEIGKGHKVNVRRPNRDFLLGIKSGQYDYNTLLAMAEERKLALDAAFAESSLPEQPDIDYIKRLTFEIRDAWYKS